MENLRQGAAAGPYLGHRQPLRARVIQACARESQWHIAFNMTHHGLQNTGQVLALGDGTTDPVQQVHATQLGV